MTGAFYYPEVIPPGVALFDFDGDADLDVFAVQSGPVSPKPRSGEGGRLFRNELDRGSLRFSDVTEPSGLDARGYGMGTAAGDYNNDGCVDLYVTSLGANQLFRNNCNGSFTDVTIA